jgi:hypothetical protein
MNSPGSPDLDLGQELISNPFEHSCEWLYKHNAFYLVAPARRGCFLSLWQTKGLDVLRDVFTSTTNDTNKHTSNTDNKQYLYNKEQEKTL